MKRIILPCLLLLSSCSFISIHTEPDVAVNNAPKYLQVDLLNCDAFGADCMVTFPNFRIRKDLIKSFNPFMKVESGEYAYCMLQTDHHEFIVSATCNDIQGVLNRQ